MKRMIVMGIATTMLAVVLSACGKANQTEDGYAGEGYTEDSDRGRRGILGAADG